MIKWKTKKKLKKKKYGFIKGSKMTKNYKKIQNK